MRLAQVGLLVLAVDQASNQTHAAELLRGPYLQTASSDSIVVRWRTDVETPSLVTYGRATNDLTLFAIDLTPTTEHEVRLSGLLADTDYFYSVGSSTQTLAQGTDYRFKTHPPAGQAKPTRVWVIGDSGGITTGYSSPVPARDAYYQYATSRPTDVWLALGDNAYNSGTDQEYQKDFFEPFSAMLRRTAVWSTIGNHETYSAPPGQPFPYLNLFSFPTNGEAGGVASGTERYYSFNYGNIHFICLDSETQNRATNGAMANWLRADLAANTNLWVIAFWHSPPYSKGFHDSDYERGMIEMRENIVPILEAHGVDLVLNGHSHIYERSYLLHGHYGYSTTLKARMILDEGSGREHETGAYIKPVFGSLANQGCIYVVLGSTSSTEDPGDSKGPPPAMYFSALRTGSLVLDINTNRLDAHFLRSTGAIDDSFTIIKELPQPLEICEFGLNRGKSFVCWKSMRGRTYRIERSESLQAPDWQPASANITANSAITSWTNSLFPGDTRLFYRVIQLAP